ncbi:MAG TPA: glycosyltransferase [Gaiellaceae bacterium]|nr:glycosyltransferase [Gaiellaceae bacterium]
MSKVTLAVATRDRAPLVRRFLVPLAGLAAERGWDVVIVDQSVNGATQALLEPLDGVRYLRSEPGLSRARNVAIQASTTPLIAFCDDDVEVAACWFDEVLRLFDEHPQAGAVCGPVRTQTGRELPGVAAAEYRWPTHPFGLGTGANVAVRRAALDQVGVFDEELGAGAPFHAAEETDLLYRIQRAGWTIVRSQGLEIVHFEERTFGEELRLHYRYGYGAGAQTAKHALEDDGAAVRFGLAEVGHHVVWFGRSLVTARPRAAVHQLPFLAGFGVGFARRRLSGQARREYSSANGRVAGPGA